MKTLLKFAPKVDDKPYIQEVEAGLIDSDPRYQRNIDKVKVRTYQAEYWEPALGVLIVNERKDGSLWIIDGQHRLEMVKQAFGDEHPVLCLVYHLASVQEEARLFHVLNEKRKSLNGREIFDSGEVAGIGDIIRVKTFVARYGFGIQGAKEKRAAHLFAQPKTVQKLLDGVGEEKLGAALKFIKAAWPTDENRTSTDLLRGVLHFLGNYPQADATPYVSSILAQFTVDEIRLEARYLKEQRQRGDRSITLRVKISAEDVSIALLALFNKKATAARRLK
jgi:hypothetical protein